MTVYQVPSTQVEWVLETLHESKEKSATWRIVYTFTEVEFFETDYAAANFVVSKQPRGLFYDFVVCSRHFWLSRTEARALGGGKEDMDSPATRYIGRIGLKGDVVRRHVGSESEILAEMKTERERRDVMERVCNVKVAEEDLKYMKGRVASLLFDE